MALSRQQKDAAIQEISGLLESSKMTVVAKYSGVGVKDMQALRKSAKESETTVKVAKNRLVKKAMENIAHLKETDTSFMKDQVLYAFSETDEVAPAQVLDKFAKDHPTLEFVAAITEDGDVMDAQQVKQLAKLPSKDQMRSQVVGTIAAPLTGFVNVLAGNIRGLVNVLNARTQEMES